MPELIAAYRHARRPEHRADLLARGLVFGEGYLWGLAPAVFDPPYYAPDPEGRLALVVGAFEHDELVDLVAVVDAVGPCTRRGDADILGRDALEAARWSDAPLEIYADVWSWLKHGRRGIVVVDWDRLAGRLSDIAELHCETAGLARQIDRAFARPIPCPPLFVFDPSSIPQES